MQTCSDSTRKAKEEALPRTFEDHVKCVEELVAFLSNHEQEALERNTNGPNMNIPRYTRQSFLMVLESVTILTNTLMEMRVVQYTRTVTVRELKLRSITVRKEVCTVRKTFPAVTFF